MEDYIENRIYRYLYMHIPSVYPSVQHVYYLVRGFIPTGCGAKRAESSVRQFDNYSPQTRIPEEERKNTNHSS